MTDILPDSEYRGLGPAVAPEYAGFRLDRYLAFCFPFRGRNDWKHMCEERRVLVDGKPRHPHRKLKGGELLKVYHPLTAEPEVAGKVEIVYGDGEIALITKPAGLPMHESGYFRRRTVQAFLRAILGSNWDAVHRLDRETSGLLLCAGSAEVKAELSKLFEMKQVKKTYVALVHGVPNWREFRLKAPIASDESSGFPRYSVREDGLPSDTGFHVLATNAAYSLIAATPFTGRTHQIRVHLSHLNLPIVGDKVYQSHPATSSQWERHALHAAKVEFLHPRTGRLVTVAAALPDDFTAMLKQVSLPWHDRSI